MKNVFHVFSRMFTKFLGERPFKSTFSAHRADTSPATVTPDLFRGRFTRNTQQAQFPFTEHVSSCGARFFHHFRFALALCVALLAATTAFAEEYITDVMVIGGSEDRVEFLKDSCESHGWIIINQDLNAGAGKETDYVYLLYKKSSEGYASNGFITDFIIKTDDYPDSYVFNGRTYYRAPSYGSSWFEKHGGNLNSGTVLGSTNMRLYYTKEEFPDRRIVSDIAFTDTKLKSDYTTVGKNGGVVGSDGSGALDLNEGAGSRSDYIYMHFATVASSMGTPEYITDVMVIGGDKDRVGFLKDSCGGRGWSIIDKDLNSHAGGDYVYLLYKKSSEDKASNGFITDFIIKTGDNPDSFTFNGRMYYRALHKGSEHFENHGGNLNSGTESNSTNMWLYYTKEEFPDKHLVSGIAFTNAKLKSGYTTVGENGAVVGSDGAGAMDLNEGAGSSSDYIYMHFATVSSFWYNTPMFASDVVVLGGSKDKVKALKERYASQGWIVIDQDLNDNAGAGTDYIYMAYKKSHFSDVNKGFITDFIIKTGEHPDFFTFNSRTYYRAPNFGDGNFAIYGGNLNSGTVSSSTNMWLYFTRESFPDSRVVSDIAFTTGDDKTKPGYTTLGENGAAVGSDGSGAMDLNEGAGSSSDYIYMHFATAPKVDITFVTGDENVSVPTQTIVFGSTPIKPSDPERAGLKFKGWFADDAFSTEFVFSSPVTSNISVYAKWEASVAFVSGVENVSVPSQTVVFGNTPTKPSDPKRTGFTFIGWYTSADGNTLFDFSTPVTSDITVYARWWNGDLSTLANNGSYVAEDGYVLRGELASISKISIADGATVTLKDVTIEGFSDKNDKYEWAGITCLGDCKIILEGLNNVKGFWEDYPGIHVPEGKTLTIEGGENDTLYASSNGWGAGLGGGFAIGCGNIEIKSGTVVATGGKNAAGIGLGEVRNGVVTSCGNITIASSVTRVMATGGEGAPYSIGLGKKTGTGLSSVGIITIGDGDVFVNGIPESPFIYPSSGLYTYTVVFRANGGEGMMPEQKIYLGYSSSLSANVYTRTNYSFVGWNTASDGSGTFYAAGASVLNLASQAGATATLYAQWVKDDGNVINLKDLTKDFVVQDGYLLTGKPAGNYKVSIADGATVTLFGATIFDVGGNDCEWAGLTCKGNCKVILKAINTVKGCPAKSAYGSGYSGIYVPSRKTLTIEGNGSLEALGNGEAAGIGGSTLKHGGNIVINGGTVTATGGYKAAGIGGAGDADVGDITISGGAVTATGGICAAGIGVGSGFNPTSVGDITISGGTVTAMGGKFAPGIGGGCSGQNGNTVGDITITDGVTLVTATKGKDSPNSIGLGRLSNKDHKKSVVGTITIGGVVIADDIPESSFTYPSSDLYTYTVVFRANGGEGMMPEQKIFLGYSSPLSANVYTRTNYGFVGWNTAPDGSGTFYADGTSVLNLASQAGATVTLYAQWWNGSDLSILTDNENYVAADGWVLMGKLASNSKISIADGATVTLKDVTIVGVSDEAYKWAGITCLGDCNIILEGENLVKGFWEDYPGIYVPKGKTLTIEGSGSLDASSNGWGAGIGGGFGIGCGNINIMSGTVIATGGKYAAGIGLGGSRGGVTSCGNITIASSVTRVTATGGEYAPYSIGLGSKNGKSSVGTITIGGEEMGNVSASPFVFPYTVVFDKNGGEGTMDGQILYIGNDGTLNRNKFARNGYSFVGWNTESEGNGVSYADGAIVDLTNVVNATMTLYAQWIKDDGNIINLKDLTKDSVVQNGYLLTGKLGGNYKVSIADGATVTLIGTIIIPIGDEAYGWAGITCEGDCKIILKGANAVKGFSSHYPGIYVPKGKTLTIEGDGSLEARGNTSAAGIGAGYEDNCGNIVISGGTVTAMGGEYAAGIGGGSGFRHGHGTAGDIMISGGVVTATGGRYAAGIGGGYGYNNTTVGDITISGGSVTATGGDCAAGIGSGYGYNNATVGDITISGGTVTAMGGYKAAGIGGGIGATVGNITITDGVTLVTATKGEDSPNSIGLGKRGKTVGTVTIGGVVADGIPKSPFTYPSSDLYTYTVVFRANGGEGMMPEQKIYLGCSSPLLANAFTKKGFSFLGWNTDSDGSGTFYAAGTSVLNLASLAGATVTLYAQWVKDDWNVINLKDLTKDSVVQDGSVLTGKLGGNYKVSIADGATVTLIGATIIGLGDKGCEWAGLTCNGNCKIILKDVNTVNGCPSQLAYGNGYPGIYVPKGKTLTIEGDGYLDARGNHMAAGIGGGREDDCGNIVISGGSVTAMGGNYAAGIGGGDRATVGDITISGGSVTATGGLHAAGIGGGICAATVGDITISGGSVTAKGGFYAAGIGGGDRTATVGNITITDGVTLVTATKGEDSPNSIGLGYLGNSVGTITIGGVNTGNVSTNPFIYQPYSVVFNANGGSGFMDRQHFSFGDDPVALSKNAFTREGYTFVGWNTKADGEGLAYSNREKVQDLVSVSGAEITLYAQWNKTVQSLAAIVISQDGNGKLHATINGDYAGKDKVSIEREVGIDVAKVELDRSFNTVGYATITLPFGIDSAKVKGAKQFLKFIGVVLNKETNLREVHMERAWCDLPALLDDIDNMNLGDEEKQKTIAKITAKCNAAPKKLFAYTPYVVQMGSSLLKFDASAAEPVTLVKTPDAADTVVGNWVFRGTLAPKVWEEGDPEIGNAYGYVAKTGDFMKVGDNSSIGALRSYLVYKQQPKANVPGMSNIQANFSTETLPANMDVVIVDDDENGKEHRTVIGKFNTHTGEFKFTLPENGTFDVKGRRVNETRSVGKGRKAKGVYYGRKK